MTMLLLSTEVERERGGEVPSVISFVNASEQCANAPKSTVLARQLRIL